MQQGKIGWLPRSRERAPLSKSAHRKQTRALRLRLLRAQDDLRRVERAAVVVVAGVDGAGKGETVNRLTEWMDPRFIRTRAFDSATDEEIERPTFWRYWRSLPPHGYTTLFLSAWYSEPLLKRVDGATRAWLDGRLEEIRQFERTLAREGTAVLKIWLHLDRAAQERRFQSLASDPERSWRVTPRDWENLSRYEAFADATEEILDATHARHAPWLVIDGSEPKRRSLDVGEAMVRALARPADPASSTTSAPDPSVHLACEDDDDAALSPSESVSKHAYQKELERRRAELSVLHRAARARGVSLICVFEGRDASGKGGAIRRLAPAFDVRRVDVVRIGPPSEEERAHHYMWRFWNRLPRAGFVTVFDRSWYGRVLVERVEQLISPADWERAYTEINDFERQIVGHGTVLVKCWLDVSHAEQARRFEERQRLAHKRWKLTDEDLRNRERWAEYSAAASEMWSSTGEAAPWNVIPADCKRSARLRVLDEVARALESRLERGPG